MAAKVGEQAVRSTSFLLIRRIVGYSIRFAVVGVLARQLTFDEFGVVAIAATCIGIMTMFGNGGVNTWVVYDREEGWEQRARSAWWLNIALTAAQCVVAAGLVPVVVWAYNEPRLAPVLVMMLATFFIEQMRIVPYALLERNLQFRAVATRDLAYDVLTGVFGIAMALGGMGLWSLVLPRFVLSPFFFAISLGIAKWTPGWSLYRGDWKRILSYSAPLMGSGILHTLANNGDTVIVGKVLGTTTAGLYNVAYMLANLVGRNVTSVLVQVSTPALAKIRERSSEIGDASVKLYRVISVVTTPMLAGMFAIAPDIVLLVYGPKWIAVVPILRVFIVFTLVRAVTSPSGAIFNVVGRTDMSLKMYAVLVPLIAVGVIAGSYEGVLGVAIGVTIARVISGCLSYVYSLKVVGAHVWKGTFSLLPGVLASLVMAAVVWLAREEAQALGLTLFTRLLATIPLGAIIYVVLLRSSSATSFAELVSVARRLAPSRRRRKQRNEQVPEQ